MAKKKKKKQLKQKKKKSAMKKANKKPQTSAAPKSKKSTKKPKKQQKSKAKPKAKPQAKVAAKSKQQPKAKQHSRISKYLYKARTPILIGFTGLALFIAFELSSIVLTYELLNSAAPGTKVAGVDVSSLTVDELQNKLIENGQPFVETPIKVELDGQEQEFLPSELGITLEPRSTIKEINFVKFDNSNLATLLSSAWNGNQVSFHNNVDVELAASNIEERFVFTDKKSRNAYLTFEGGILTIVPEKEGQNIDIRQLFNDLKANASHLDNKKITIATQNLTPLVTAADLELQLDEITEKLKQKIILNYENFNYNIKPIDYIDWIRFDYSDVLNVGDIASLDLNLNTEGLFNLSENVLIEKELKITVLHDPFELYIDETLSPLLESEPEGVKIWRNEEGQVMFEGKGENGQTINRNHLLTGVTLAINNSINEVQIPILLQPAEVDISDDLKELGITELIATGKSAFAGSTNNRIHNINTGIGKFQGHIIEPGETFSFNTILGPVEAYTGFLPELVIKPEGTIPEYGGGLCQVSSTMFRAALMAGLPIVERTPHSYAVSYYSQVYGYGLDATIYPGVHDVRFTNDTPGHILIQGYTDGIKAFFKMYGTSDGRFVELEGPYLGGYHAPGPPVYVETPTLAPGQTKWMESSHTGFSATWYRHLTDKDGNYTEEPLYTNYKAIPARILVGPGGSEGEPPG